MDRWSVDAFSTGGDPSVARRGSGASTWIPQAAMPPEIWTDKQTN